MSRILSRWTDRLRERSVFCEKSRMSKKPALKLRIAHGLQVLLVPPWASPLNVV